MRPRKSFVIVTALSICIICTYYWIFLKHLKVNQHKEQKSSSTKLIYIEDNIKYEVDVRKHLVDEVIRIIKKKEPTPSTTVDSIPIVVPPDQKTETIVVVPENPLEKFKDVYVHNEPIIPIIVFACNRITVRDCLDNLLKYRPNVERFPIIVSQDCGDNATKNVILSYGDNVTLIQQPDLSDIQVLPKEKKFKGYYKIARHYGWALNEVFNVGFDAVVIVEDDLAVAPDFFEYFMGTYPVLKRDPTLWCISAWNDNGKRELTDDKAKDLLYRTDFFPGLGWMLTKKLWDEELSPKWPKGFWDDWIRQPEQRKNRSCIRPELPRTRTFGKIGVSNGLFFDKHLKFIQLSRDFTDFSKMDLSYLEKTAYDKMFLRKVHSAKQVKLEELLRGLEDKEPIRITYNTRDQFKRTAKTLGLMDDFKSGVPRTAYLGIVSCFYKDQRVYLTPNSEWKTYDPSWS